MKTKRYVVDKTGRAEFDVNQPEQLDSGEKKDYVCFEFNDDFGQGPTFYLNRNDILKFQERLGQVIKDFFPKH